MSAWWRRRRKAVSPVETGEVTAAEIDLTDPFAAYLLSMSSPVVLTDFEAETPLSESLRADGAAVAVPLISQGELVGILALGPRRSERPYSPDDLRLLDQLASRAAPALRLAELVRRQADEARERERITQELRVARLIQQNFLPTVLPELDGWALGAHYRPAREVGGDFYDFVTLGDGRIGIVIGDVTDKGVPAALVMATTRSLIREAIHQLTQPADVLARVNRSLHADIPANMFVTCQYALVDPATGDIVLANAGHCLPYLHRAGAVSEVRATGLPLGLMPEAKYEQIDVSMPDGSGLLFHSDGLAEAHAPDGEMFGMPRLMGLVGKHPGGIELIDLLLAELAAFTGPGWEVEDDVTLVSVQRSGSGSEARQVLDEFSAASRPGGELDVARRVAAAVGSLLGPDRRQRLETAVAEAAMNAMEHGNAYRADLDITVTVTSGATGVAVTIGDEGLGGDIPEATAPDLAAKLAGEQSPRGWGLFLVRQMVDDVSTTRRGGRHVIELTMRRDGDTP